MGTQSSEIQGLNLPYIQNDKCIDIQEGATIFSVLDEKYCHLQI